MAQIPRLERFQQSNTLPQNNRINLQAKDQGSNILQQTNAIADLGDKGAQMYQMYENDKIEQISNVAETEYTKWNQAQLERLKNHQGDPTDAYAEYEKSVSQKKADMIAARPDYGENVMTAVTGRLDKVISHQSIAADHQRGQQQEIYANNVFESTVKLKRDGMAVNAGYIKKDDPTSFTMFDQNVSDIKTAIAKRGFKQGTAQQLPDDAENADHVFTDDNGKVVKVALTPIAKARVAKDLSEGVKSSLDVLISTGRIDEARTLQKRYGGVLTAVQAAKLEAKFQTASRKNEAYNVLGSLKGLDDDSAIEKIDDIKDPALKSEVLKIKDADDRRISNMRTRREKVNYDKLGDYVLQKMNSDQPFNGIAELEADPLYQETYDNMSVKQKKAVHEMVEAPKESNSKSLVKVQGLFMSDDDGVPDINDMSPQDFAQEIAGLSKSDRAKYTSLYMSLKTETDGERRAKYKSAGSILKNQMILDGHISLNAYGKLDEDNQKVLTAANNKLMKFLSTNPNLKDDSKIAEFVKTNSAQLVKDKAFNPLVPKSSGRKTATDDGNVKVTKQQLVDLQREFRMDKKNGGYFPPLTDPKFEAFIKSKMKKG